MCAYEENEYEMLSLFSLMTIYRRIKGGKRRQKKKQKPEEKKKKAKTKNKNKKIKQTGKSVDEKWKRNHKPTIRVHRSCY